MKHIYQTQLTPKTKQYLYSRGINDESIDFFKLGEALDFYTELNNVKSKRVFDKNKKDNKTIPFFFNRLTIPVLNQNLKVVGYSCRALDDNNSVKYLKSRHLTKRDFFGIQTIKEDTKRVYIFEGQIDAILHYQNTGYASIAPLGSYISKEVIENLVLMGIDEFIIVGDRDKAGTKFNLQASKLILSLDLYCKIGTFKGGKDLGELKHIDKNTISLISPFAYRNKIFQAIKEPFKKAKTFKELFEGLNLSQMSLKEITYQDNMQKHIIILKYKTLANIALSIPYKLLSLGEKKMLEKENSFFNYILNELDFVVIDEVKGELYFNNKRELTEKEEEILKFLYTL